MRVCVAKRIALLLVVCALVACASEVVSSAPTAALPNPILTFTGQESVENGGKLLTRYNYAVYNFDDYPPELFAPAPDLPPCGNNRNAARTWVDLYEQSGRRLYGFCALKSPQDLGHIWFMLDSDAVPPSWIYIELNDRKTNTKYKSNLAETTY